MNAEPDVDHQAQFEKNKADAARHLARFAAEPTPHLINGEPVASVDGETFENTSPVDGALLGTVSAGGPEDVDAAARAAAAAFPSWADTPGTERRAILHNVADLIEERAEQIALVESVDTGQAIRFMSSAAVRGAANFRFFADQAPSAADGA